MYMCVSVYIYIFLIYLIIEEIKTAWKVLIAGSWR